MNFKKVVRGFLVYILIFSNVAMGTTLNVFAIEESGEIQQEETTGDQNLNLTAGSYALMNCGSKEDFSNSEDLGKALQKVYDDCELISKNANEKRQIASLTKIMLAVLVCDKIKKDKNFLKEVVSIDRDDVQTYGTKIYLEHGEKITIEELFDSLMINSANDAAKALAIAISGSEENCAKMMNAKAKELGLNNTCFINATGLDDEEVNGTCGYSTAADLAKLSYYLVNEYDWILKITSKYESSIRNSNTKLYNTNKLVKRFDGSDGEIKVLGLKTGFTDKAGSCLVSYAYCGGKTLIAVVLGCPDSETRFKESIDLLKYGSSNYEYAKFEIDKKNLQPVKISNGIKAHVEPDLNLSSLNKVLVPKGGNSDLKHEIKYYNNLEAPIKKGEEIGVVKFRVGKDGGKVYRKGIVAKKDVEKITLMKVFLLFLNEFFICQNKSEC